MFVNNNNNNNNAIVICIKFNLTFDRMMEVLCTVHTIHIGTCRQGDFTIKSRLAWG